MGQEIHRVVRTTVCDQLLSGVCVVVLGCRPRDRLGPKESFRLFAKAFRELPGLLAHREPQQERCAPLGRPAFGLLEDRFCPCDAVLVVSAPDIAPRVPSPSRKVGHEVLVEDLGFLADGKQMPLSDESANLTGQLREIAKLTYADEPTLLVKRAQSRFAHVLVDVRK